VDVDYGKKFESLGKIWSHGTRWASKIYINWLVTISGLKKNWKD
jgi:hypothetical protein